MVYDESEILEQFYYHTYRMNLLQPDKETLVLFIYFIGMLFCLEDYMIMVVFLVAFHRIAIQGAPTGVRSSRAHRG